MKILISIPIILIYVYYIIRKNRTPSSDSHEMTNTQKMLDIFSSIVLALLVGFVWGFAYGATYQFYSFPKEHSLVFHIASLIVFICALEIMDFFRNKALKTIIKWAE